MQELETRVTQLQLQAQGLNQEKELTSSAYNQLKEEAGREMNQ